MKLKVFGAEHEDVSIYVEQCSFNPHNEWDARVINGQLDSDGIGNIVFTGASYQYPHPGDVIHIASKGQNTRGVNLARAVAINYFGTGFIPIKVIAAYWTATNKVELVTNMQIGNLVKDETGTVVNPDGLGVGCGFNVMSYDGKPVSIESVSVVRNIVIELTLNNPQSAEKIRVAYARKKTDNSSPSGAFGGARGLFRSSVGIENLYTGETEYFWLPSFIIEGV